MVPPGDISLVSKTATEQAVTQGSADSCQAKLTFPKQLRLSQPQSTATEERKGAPLIFFFFKSSADYWGQVNLIPLMLVTRWTLEPLLRKLGWSPSEILSESSRGSGQQDYCR